MGTMCSVTREVKREDAVTLRTQKSPGSFRMEEFYPTAVGGRQTDKWSGRGLLLSGLNTGWTLVRGTRDRHVLLGLDVHHFKLRTMSFQPVS